MIGVSSPIPATEFKAKCLALLDRVAERRESFVISKHGKAVAKLVPLDATKKKHKSLIGSVTIVDSDDDLLSTGLRWDIEDAADERITDFAGSSSPPIAIIW